MNNHNIAYFKYKLAMKIVEDYLECGDILEDTYDFIELYFQSIVDKIEGMDRKRFCECQTLCSQYTGKIYNNWLYYTGEDNEHWGWEVELPMLSAILLPED